MPLRIAGKKSLIVASPNSSIWTLLNGADKVYHQSNNSIDAQNYALANPASVVTQSKYSGILSGVLSGAAALNIDGGGTTVLTAANTYSGGTTVKQGATLQLGKGGAQAASAGSGGIVVSSGANMVLNWSGANNTLANTITGAGAITLMGDGITTNTNGSYNLTNFSGFTGSIILNKARLSLTSAQGTCPISCGSGSGIYANGAITINNPLSISGNSWAGDAVTNQALRLDSGVTWAGAITLNGATNIGSFAGGGSISGVISGSANLNVNNGSGVTLTLKGTNTHSGVINVNSGILDISPSTLYTKFSSSAVNINNASTVKTGAAGTYFKTSWNFDAAGGGTLNFTGNPLNGTGAAGSGNTINSNGGVSNTILGNLNLFSGTSVLTINAAPAANPNSPAIIINSVMSNAASTLNKNGAGIIQFTNPSTSFPAGTINLNAGTIQLSGTASLGGIGSTTNVASGAALNSLSTTLGTLGAVTFSALASKLIVTALTTTSASKLSCTTLTATNGFTIDVNGAMNAGTYPILTSTSGTPTPSLGTNTSGRTVAFAWSGNNLNMTLT